MQRNIRKLCLFLTSSFLLAGITITASAQTASGQRVDDSAQRLGAGG
jgi:hypothetical protein